MVADRMKAMGSNGYVGSAAAAIIAGVSLVAQRMPYMPKPSEYRFPCFPAPYLVYGPMLSTRRILRWPLNGRADTTSFNVDLSVSLRIVLCATCTGYQK